MGRLHAFARYIWDLKFFSLDLDDYRYASLLNRNVFPVLFVVSIDGYVLACFFTTHSRMQCLVEANRSTRLSTVTTPSRDDNTDGWNIKWLYLHNKRMMERQKLDRDFEFLKKMAHASPSCNLRTISYVVFIDCRFGIRKVIYRYNNKLNK